MVIFPRNYWENVYPQVLTTSRVHLEVTIYLVFVLRQNIDSHATSIQNQNVYFVAYTAQQCNSAGNIILTMQRATVKGPRVFESSSNPTLTSGIALCTVL